MVLGARTQPQPSPGGQPITTWGSFRKGVKASGIPWLFVAPALLVMLFISLLPQIYQVFIAFRDFRAENLGGAPAPFVGFQNFAQVFAGLNVPNYDFFALLGFNIWWTVINVVIHVTLGVAVAMALNAENVIGRRLYRTLFVIPWALPPYITGLIWNNMWQQNGGGINLIAQSANNTFGTDFSTNTAWLTSLQPSFDIRPIAPYIVIVVGVLMTVLLVRGLVQNGLRDSATGRIDTGRALFVVSGIVVFALAAVVTLVDLVNGGEVASPAVGLFDRAGAPVLAFWAVLIANSWLGWPFMMVVATGALQSIPPDLYEAADVDGATGWEQFLYITIPMIRPAMVPAIMLGTIWTFNNFNIIFFITAGGPRGETDLLVTQAYKLIAQNQLYGAAAAFSIVVFFVLLIITLINNRITRATEAFNE